MRPPFRPTAAVSPAQERAQAASALFGAGAILGGLTLLAPGWEWMDRRTIWVIVGLSVVASAGLWRIGRLSVGAAHGVVSTGVVIVSLLQIVSGGGASTAATGVLYSWAAVFSFAMFSRTGALAQVALMVAGQTGALVFLGEADNAPAQVTLTIGAALAMGLVVGALVDRIRQLAALDSLTGLSNRRAAEETLARAQADAARSGAPLSLAVIDLDKFKELNDTRGHAAGDRVLQACARNWSAELRAGDLLARMGGDEFLAILTDCSTEQAREIAGRLATATPLPVRCSIGVAVWDGIETMDALLARADVALYVAKDRFRGGVNVDGTAAAASPAVQISGSR